MSSGAVALVQVLLPFSVTHSNQKDEPHDRPDEES